MSHHDHSACPHIQVLSVTYDGPSVFLQGQNGVALKIEGTLVANTRLDQPTFKIDVFGTFLDNVDVDDNQVFFDVYMQPIGEPVISLSPSTNNNPDEHTYTFEASYRSVFCTFNCGRCNIRATFQYVPSECIFAEGVDVRGVIVVSVGFQEDNTARHQGTYVNPPDDFDRAIALGDQGPGIFTCPGEQSELMVEPPVSPVGQRLGDMGRGQYVGHGEDANWERSPSPAPSNVTTIANTEADDDYSIPDTASQSRLSPERETLEVQLPPLPHD